MSSILRGIFLTSENPARTTSFYREVAGLNLEPVGDAATYIYWKFDHDGLQVAIHDAKQFAAYTHPARPDSNLTHLYFKIEDQGRFLRQLAVLGIQPCAVDDVVVTVEDPDGRKVMFGTA